MSSRRDRALARRRARRRGILLLGGIALALVIAVGLWLGRDTFAGDQVADGGTPTEAASVQPTDAATDEPTPEPTQTPEPEPDPEPVEFSLVMAGDVLPHATVNKNALQADGTYNYVPMMERLRGYIEGADIALCSLEVPLAPEGEQVSAYPVFGAPAELITSLKEIGWDGCATATNHSLDRGKPGLYRTLDVMDEVGLGHAGTGRTPEETASAQFYEVERDGASFTLAHISATTFHNDYVDPMDFADVLNPLVTAQPIIDVAHAAREAGADVVVFTPHWGQEYWKETDGLQRELASALAASGEIDVILGGHAHVPQPLVKLDGGADGDGMWVAYSMGNFLSNQDEQCCNIATATGLMPRATIVVEGDDVAITDVTWTANMVDTQGGQILYPVHELLAGPLPSGITLTQQRITDRWNAMTAILGTDQYDPSLPATGGATVTVVPRDG